MFVLQYETAMDSENPESLQPMAYHTVNRRYSEFLNLQTRLEEKPELRKILKSEQSLLVMSVSKLSKTLSYWLSCSVNCRCERTKENISWASIWKHGQWQSRGQERSFGNIPWSTFSEYINYIKLTIFNISFPFHTTYFKCLFMLSLIIATLCHSWNGQQWGNARISRSKHWCKNCLCEETLHCFTHRQGTFQNAHCIFWLKHFT